MVSRAQLKVSFLYAGSLSIEHSIPKSMVKYNSTTLLVWSMKGKGNCLEVHKTDLLMVKLNNLRHQDGEFDCVKHVWK